MDSIIYLVSRFHPLIVHVPIALLPLAGMFWMASRFDKFKHLEVAIKPLLSIGLLAALGSVVSGFALASVGEYDDSLLIKHQAFGIISTVVGLLALWALHQKRNPKAIGILLGVLVIGISLTGHWGGLLTHGENWFGMNTSQQQTDALEKIKSIPIDSGSRAVLYSDLVAPVLQARCVNCHNAQKQKGELRLDAAEKILAGGKHGNVLDAKHPEKSELLTRILKTIEEKGHMPPRQEAQLSNLEIELVKWWVMTGASFDKSVGELKPPMLLTKLWRAKPTESLADWLPEQSIEPISHAAFDSVEKYGFKVTPIAQQSNYLMVSTAGERTIPDRGWQHIANLKKHVVDFEASYIDLNATALASISALQELRRLKLNHTNLTDANLKQLTACLELRSLHVVNTPLTASCQTTLQEFKLLKEVFAFQTGLPASLTLPNIQLNTGNYSLTQLPTDTIVYRAK